MPINIIIDKRLMPDLILVLERRYAVFGEESGKGNRKGQTNERYFGPFFAAHVDCWRPTAQFSESRCSLFPRYLQHRAPFRQAGCCNNTDTEHLKDTEQRRQHQCVLYRESAAKSEELEEHEFVATSQPDDGGQPSCCGYG